MTVKTKFGFRSLKMKACFLLCAPPPEGCRNDDSFRIVLADSCACPFIQPPSTSAKEKANRQALGILSIQATRCNPWVN